MKNEYLGLSDTPLLEWLAEFFTRSLQRLTDLSAEPTSICFGWERFPFCPITKRAKTGRCFLPAGFSNPHSNIEPFTASPTKLSIPNTLLKWREML